MKGPPPLSARSARARRSPRGRRSRGTIDVSRTRAAALARNLPAGPRGRAARIPVGSAVPVAPYAQHKEHCARDRAAMFAVNAHVSLITYL